MQQKRLQNLEQFEIQPHNWSMIEGSFWGRFSNPAKSLQVHLVISKASVLQATIFDFTVIKFRIFFIQKNIDSGFSRQQIKWRKLEFHHSSNLSRNWRCQSLKGIRLPVQLPEVFPSVKLLTKTEDFIICDILTKSPQNTLWIKRWISELTNKSCTGLFYWYFIIYLLLYRIML